MSGHSTCPTRWLSQDERAAWLAVSGLIAKLPSALDAQLQRDASLSYFEYMVLAVLSEQPDRTLQMSEIAAFASASLSRLSHTATRLESQGLITREPAPGQGRGRRMQATLTEAGYEKVRATALDHVTHVRELLIDDLTAHEIAVLTRIGNRAMDRIEAASTAKDEQDPDMT